MNYTISTFICILFNGGTLEPFKPKMGLKQGDHLSLYLFILCIKFLRAFIHQKMTLGLGVTNSLVVELRGLLEGLKLALSLNISNLITKMDALTIVNIISSRAFINPLLNPLVFECMRILEIISNKLIKHVFREANKCVEFFCH